jgi:hypothetical protein
MPIPENINIIPFIVLSSGSRRGEEPGDGRKPVGAELLPDAHRDSLFEKTIIPAKAFDIGRTGSKTI